MSLPRIDLNHTQRTDDVIPNKHADTQIGRLDGYSSFDSEDDHRWGRRNVSHYHQQFFFIHYINLDNHISQTPIDTPRIKLFTLYNVYITFVKCFPSWMWVFKYRVWILLIITLLCQFFIVFGIIFYHEEKGGVHLFTRFPLWARHGLGTCI